MQNSVISLKIRKYKLLNDILISKILEKNKYVDEKPVSQEVLSCLVKQNANLTKQHPVRSIIEQADIQ